MRVELPLCTAGTDAGKGRHECRRGGSSPAGVRVRGRHRSFSRAAEELLITQPGPGRTLAQLEGDLSTRKVS
ncbi:LysR family transcriptional regulator [Streptomyces massasporeus]|uniref:helix-turn-helix domain-containing protein n=1 Tax=Streptomyces massasporeus TaxID=67324 RepID=UPI003454B40E